MNGPVTLWPDIDESLYSASLVNVCLQRITAFSRIYKEMSK